MIGCARPVSPPSGGWMQLISNDVIVSGCNASSLSHVRRQMRCNGSHWTGQLINCTTTLARQFHQPSQQLDSIIHFVSKNALKKPPFIFWTIPSKIYRIQIFNNFLIHWILRKFGHCTWEMQNQFSLTYWEPDTWMSADNIRQTLFKKWRMCIKRGPCFETQCTCC